MGGEEEKTIPYARFSEVLQERNELKPKAENYDKLVKEHDELKQKYTALEEDTVIMGTGLADPEGRELARYLHGKLPPEGRPPIGEWLTGLKAEPTKMPKALAPYWPTAATGGAQGGAQGGGAAGAGGARQVPPKTAAGGSPAAGAPAAGAITKEQMNAGSWSEQRAEWYRQQGMRVPFDAK